MAVAASDMKLIEATTMPASFATASVGVAIGSTEISGALGQVFFRMSSNASGGGDRTQYSKIFDLNDHATYTINSYGVWISNSVDTLGTAATISFASSSASDDATKKITVVGKSSGGAAQTEDVTMNGTSSVVTTLTYTGRCRWILKLVSTGATTTAAGDITGTFSASTVGVIPAGLKTATGEIDIALASALDDSATITDASTAPSGPSFTKPRVSGSKLTTDAGTGTQEAGEAQGIWMRWTLPELMNPSAEVQVSIKGTGEAV